MQLGINAKSQCSVPKVAVPAWTGSFGDSGAMQWTQYHSWTAPKELLTWLSQCSAAEVVPRDSSY